MRSPVFPCRIGLCKLSSPDPNLPKLGTMAARFRTISSSCSLPPNEPGAGRWELRNHEDAPGKAQQNTSRNGATALVPTSFSPTMALSQQISTQLFLIKDRQDKGHPT
mmetsp:Transcript_36760/g.57481  ORF Transcript_36760/g.57481 Transcript_36760/m.57481 type:complete len:108 (+) Transcript_36760:1487-1810(+)